MSIKKVYVIGSLRNRHIPEVAGKLRAAFGNVEVFDDWFAAGPEADDKWKEYEQARGRDYKEALKGYAARNVFRFDKTHLDTADAAVLVLPAGRSGHLEAGYMIGCGKPVFILLDDVAGKLRWDVMYQFATAVVSTVDELVAELGALVVAEPFQYPPGPAFPVFSHGAPALGSAGNWR